MSAVDRLNLARRPFSNRSPRRRLRIVLWAVAGVLILLNSFLFAQYWISSSSSREELRKVREASDQQVETMRALEARLANVDLDTQNEQVRFLNRKIAERTFPWSELFDDLAAVLPRDVRLVSIAPGIEDDTRKRRGQALPTSIEWIGLDVSARAKKPDDVLDLIDAMFEHPSFAGPTLAQESLREGEIEFDASVRYRVTPLAAPEPRDESTELVIAGDRPDGASGVNTNGPAAGSSSGSTGSTDGATTRRTSAGGSTLVDDEVSAGDARTRPTDEPRAGVPGSRGSGAESRQSDPGAPRTPQSDAGPATRSAPSRTAAGGNPAAPRSIGVPVAAERASRAAAEGGAPSTGDDLPAAVPGSAEAIADERFGRDEPRAPRVENASGNNGGAR